MVCLFTPPAYAGTKFLVTEAIHVHVNNLSKVALNSATAGIAPSISSRKYYALTATPPSHALNVPLLIM